MTSASTADDDPDAFPRAFGQYLLLENFARGGMGEVYLAKIGAIAGLERYCVLKKLRSELTRDREYVTRFIDEARVVVTLNHANICHVFDVGRVGEEYYLAMEYISGRDVRTLQDRCRARERPIPAASALQIVCEILEALDYAHRRNHPLTGEPLKLVHRDVSPQNVLVSYEGEVKLIDFGLAASKLKVERTQPNVVMGKMAYMAPEQARGDPIDARADLFACGVLLYELIAGERYYEAMTANDIWQVAGKGGFTPRKWDSLDKELAKHVAKALHPDPKRRFATCGDFREALASHLHWRFPGSGVRGVREMMSEVFADELRREREMLARFGTVTVAGFHTEFEETKSQSISLARADETSPTVVKPATQLVRNEQSSSSSPAGPMPPPFANSRDVHQDPTRLVSAKNTARPEATQRKPQPAKDSTDEQPEHEPTMRVARARPPSVDENTALSIGPSPTRRFGFIAAAAIAVVAVVLAVSFLLPARQHPADVPVDVAVERPPPPPPPAPPSTPAADPVLEPIAAKAEPALEAKAAPEVEAKAEPKLAAKAAPKLEPKAEPKRVRREKAHDKSGDKHTAVVEVPPPAVAPTEPAQPKLPTIERAVRAASTCTPCKEKATAFVMGANDEAQKSTLAHELQVCVAQKCQL